jgi:hypothetical protein
MNTEHTLAPSLVISNLHRLLESTTLMRCASKQVAEGAFGLLAFRAGTPDDVVAQQVAYADEVDVPPEAMVIAVATPLRVSIVVQRISRPMGGLIVRLVQDACAQARTSSAEQPVQQQKETP